MNDPREPRDLTFEEKSTWGECPVCKAEHGAPCHPEVGIQLGHRVDGRPMQRGDGAHLARLNAAPKAVRLVACG